jgi:hypothetical protein
MAARVNAAASSREHWQNPHFDADGNPLFRPLEREPILLSPK